MGPSGPTVSECSSLATGMPASVVVGLWLSFVMIAPRLWLRVNRRGSFRSSFFPESHTEVGGNEVLLRIIAQFEGYMMSVGARPHRRTMALGLIIPPGPRSAAPPRSRPLQ